MKKPVCVFLSLLMILCVFAGCDSSENPADSQNQMETFGGQSATETTVTPQSTQAAVSTATANPNPTVTMPSLEGEDTEDPTSTSSTANTQNGTVTERDTDDAQTSSPSSGTQNASGSQSTSTPKTTGTGSGTGNGTGNAQTTPTPETSADSDASSPASEPSTDTMSGTYASTLSKILNNGTLPDGSSTTSGSSVQYAVVDVDGDGSSELVIRVPGSKELICSYNGAGGVNVEGTVSPGATYYSNGAVTMATSSSMGYSGSTLSPYSVYSYDSSTGTYSLTATVDGWDSSLSETEDGENSFPASIDADGNGYIYIINGGEGQEMVDDAQYNSWRSAVLGGTVVSVSFQNISQADIDSMS